MSTELLDAWLEAGGNVLDTAREYDASEGVIGRWMEKRRCREDVVVVTKCAHPENGGSRLSHAEIARDLDESLEALRTTTADVLLLHRDDPQVPVGLVLEALNQELERGRVRAFGASNWSPARLDEAAAYARAHALEPFSCSSANLSLAVQNEPPWPGTLSASDPASRAWHARTRLPLFAWSAQAAGFFARGEDALRDPEVARVYGSPGNAERLRRARALARDRGTDANAVALAWVLAQPFPVHAIVGPATPAELRSTLAALDVSLTDGDARWLALETDGDAPPR